jgi:ubiquinone/menaquinone biosynthesis C-methylase UbiE
MLPITPPIPPCSKAGRAVIAEELKLRGDETILDVGCGDGKITAELARAVPRGFVLGTDASAEMIAFARKTFSPPKNPNRKFDIADARVIGGGKSVNSFDRVFPTPRCIGG